MSIGKRWSTNQPLTEHDVADRLDKAAIRVVRIMQDIRLNHPELMEPVRGSRYLTNSVNALAYELQEWSIEPVPLRNDPSASDE